jgi:hypothetical protein
VDDAPALHGRPDYTRYITFNDDVGGENIKFLLMVYQSTGDARALAAIRRAMQVYVLTQQPAPQAGWGLQHDPRTLLPVGARSYEPDALVTHTTAGNIALLLDFYQWTGDKVFLQRVPEALDWLESVRLPPDQVQIPGREFPTFIEMGTNKALINHRRGSNVVNGAYYQDYDVHKPIMHYSQWRAIDVAGLRVRLAQVTAMSAAGIAENSPLNARADFQLPPYFSTRSIEVSDLNSNTASNANAVADADAVSQLLGSLNSEGYWPTPLNATSNPYIGDGSATPATGDFAQTLVGDSSDTSPHIASNPQMGISTGTFIKNMGALLQVVARG